MGAGYGAGVMVAARAAARAVAISVGEGGGEGGVQILKWPEAASFGGVLTSLDAWGNELGDKGVAALLQDLRWWVARWGVGNKGVGC